MRSYLAVAAAVVTLASTPRVSAYCRTTTNRDFLPTAEKPCDVRGAPLSWPTSCVGFSVQRSASVQVDLPDTTRLLSDAYVAWSFADCGAVLGATCSGPPGNPAITGRDLGPVDCGEAQFVRNGGNANVLVFHDRDWSHDAAAIAITTVTYDQATGALRDADIEVQSNPERVKLATTDPVPADAYDLRSVLTHEVGHVLGLAHTSEATATMFARYGRGETFMRDLSSDDACGVCAVYPPTRSAACVPTPIGGLANACGAVEDPPSGCGCSAPGRRTFRGAWLAFALLVASAVRRRRGTIAA